MNKELHAQKVCDKSTYSFSYLMMDAINNPRCD